MKIINEFIVDDIEASIKFYKNILGFEVVETAGEPICWVRLKNGDAELMLEDYKIVVEEYKDFPPKVKTSNLVKFQYSDINEVRGIYNKVLENNIKVFEELTETEYGTTEFTILDCDSNIIIISD